MILLLVCHSWRISSVPCGVLFVGSVPPVYFAALVWVIYKSVFFFQQFLHFSLHPSNPKLCTLIPNPLSLVLSNSAINLIPKL